MTDVLKEIDDMIERGVMHSVFVGRSVTADKRFATFRVGGGDTVASGKGQTCQEALVDAVNKLTRRPAPVTLPGATLVTRMPT